jgi:biotin transport system substrate-specific component
MDRNQALGLRRWWLFVREGNPSNTATSVFLALAVVPVLMAATTALKIPVPGYPVPFTLQTLVVVLSGAWLGGVLGVTSMLAYLVYGIVLGLPFFAMGDGRGDMSYLFFQVTSGYLLCFPVASFLTARLLRDPAVRGSLPARFAVFLATTGLIVVVGSTYAASVLDQYSAAEAWSRLFLPFLPFAVVKAAIAAWLYRPSPSAR